MGKQEKLQELHCFPLMTELFEAGAPQGDIGTIGRPHHHGEAYEVDFVDENGKTVSIQTSSPVQIKPLTLRASWGDHDVPVSMFLIILYDLYVIDAIVRMVYPLWPGTWIRPMAFTVYQIPMAVLAAILGIGGAIVKWKNSKDRLDRVIAVMSFLLGLSVLPVFVVTLSILLKTMGIELAP